MKAIILIFIAIGAMHTVHAKNTQNSEPIETEIVEEAEIFPSKDMTPVPVRKSERIANNKLKKEESEPAFLSSDEVPPEEELEAIPIKKKRGRPKKTPTDLAPEHPIGAPNSFPSQDMREDTKIADTIEEPVKSFQQEPSFAESLKNKHFSSSQKIQPEILKSEDTKDTLEPKKSPDSQAETLPKPLAQIAAEPVAQIAVQSLKDTAPGKPQTVITKLKKLSEKAPKGLKNLANNISYRYFKGSEDVMSASWGLFNSFLDLGSRVMTRASSDLETATDITTKTASGALTGGITGAASGFLTSTAGAAIGTVMKSLNPAITVIQTVQSMRQLHSLLKTFFYVYKLVENGGINFISDTGRNIATFGKHALNFFKDPEEFKSIVDNYVFEKYFKYLIRLGILGYATTYYISLALPEVAASVGTVHKLKTVCSIVQSIPNIISTYFAPVMDDTKGWKERAIALKDLIFSKNIAMKEMQQSIMEIQKSLFTALNDFSLMNADQWQKDGYPGVAEMINGFKSITNGLAFGINYEIAHLDKDIYINKKVIDGKKTYDRIKSTLSDGASSAYNAASGAFNTVKNWIS